MRISVEEYLYVTVEIRPDLTDTECHRDGRDFMKMCKPQHILSKYIIALHQCICTVLYDYVHYKKTDLTTLLHSQDHCSYGAP